jgi:hypothetical protein
MHLLLVLFVLVQCKVTPLGFTATCNTFKFVYVISALETPPQNSVDSFVVAKI